MLSNIQRAAAVDPPSHPVNKNARVPLVIKNAYLDFMCAKNPISDIIPYPYDSSLGTSKTEMQYAKTYVNLDIFKFNAIFL